MKTIEEIERRLAEIAKELENEDADIDALEAEVRSLNEEKRQIREAAERRQKLMGRIAEGTAGTTVRTFKEPNAEPTVYTAASQEYRNAWLKNIAKDDSGKSLFGEMTTEERAAFTFLTTNTSAVVPTDIANRIAELVRSEAPLLNDATLTGFVRGFGVPRHKSIDQGDAKTVTEGTANDDEKDDFDLLNLAGVEIKKHIVMSRKMQIQGIDAFENWLVEHLAARVRVAKEARILAQLDNVDYGIASANKISGTLSDIEVRKIFGLINTAGVKTVYANNKTIWNVIAGLKNESGDKLFIPNSMSDPTIAGRVYGAAVKEDINIPDNVIYVGVSKSILCNDFEALEIVPQIEAKSLNRIFTAYSLFDAGLENPEAFVKYTHVAS